MSHKDSVELSLRERVVSLSSTNNKIGTFDTIEFLELKRLPESIELLASFNRLENDPYLKTEWCFRKRSFTKGVIYKEEDIVWNDDTSFFQASEINSYAGGIYRQFAPAEPILRDYTQKVLNTGVYKSLRGDDKFEIGVHQIRIVCNDDNPGFPVPEGFHQDGMDYISILCIGLHNVVGGVSLLRADKKDGKCVLESNLGPYTGLVFNDRKYFHYATPIFPKESKLGFRDIIVTTFTRC